MPPAKRKPSVSLDEDLVIELEAVDRSRRRQRRLAEMLDRLDAEHGAVEEALVEKYVKLLE